MAGTQRLLATVMAIFLTGIPGKGKTSVLGVVVMAQHASLDAAAAAEGTTVYEGERLATEAGGSIQVRAGGAMVYLAEQSSAVVRGSAAEGGRVFEAELEAGAAVLSVAAGTMGEIVASSAHIRPISDMRGVVQVRVIGQHELLVYAQRGPTLISYQGERETIAQGKSYRVVLNPPEDDARGGAGTKKTGKHGKAIILIAVAAVAATAVGITLLMKGGGGNGLESPDRP
ncbi:MAG TPA: hypothetical protein VMI32_04385 [Candidatus Solibacter sp.]|nr:hypothetical protein [Candidatus Solibacter sp.]